MTTQVVFWHWFVLAAVFVVIEMLAPGTFMLWLGVAAAVAGLMLLLWPGAAIEWQLLAFSVTAVVSVFAWRRVQKRSPVVSESPTLNQRTANYLNRVYTLVKPIENGIGMAKVDDSVWSVSGPDLPEGARVRVIGVEGTVLKVERAD